MNIPQTFRSLNRVAATVGFTAGLGSLVLLLWSDSVPYFWCLPIAIVEGVVTGLVVHSLLKAAIPK